MMQNRAQNVNNDSPQALQRQVYIRRGRQRRGRRQRLQTQKYTNKRARTRQKANTTQQQQSIMSTTTRVPAQPDKKLVKIERISNTLPSTALQCTSQEFEIKLVDSNKGGCNKPTSLLQSQQLSTAAITQTRNQQVITNQNNDKLNNKTNSCDSNSYTQHDEVEYEVANEQEDEEDVLLLRCIAHPSQEQQIQNMPCSVSCIRVGPTNVRVGRSKALCDVVLPPFPGLSRLHCVLSCVGDEISVHDRSSNGTFINGRCIGRNRCAMLHVHDCLTFIPVGAAHAEECTFTIDPTFISYNKKHKQCVMCKSINGGVEAVSLLPPKQTSQMASTSQFHQSVSPINQTKAIKANLDDNNILRSSSMLQVNKTKKDRQCSDSKSERGSSKNTALCPKQFAKLVSLSQPPQYSPSVLLSALSDPTLHEQVTTRYALGPVLGQGSFAVVRLGVHHLTKAQVAVKLIDKRHLAKQCASHAQLLMQAQIMMQIHHRHIVKVLDVYDGMDHIALVMELARQGDLFDYIVGRGKPPFTQREARLLFVQLLEALIYLHSQHIVHNDIKPQNVLVMSTRDTNEQTVTIAATEQPSMFSSHVSNMDRSTKRESDIYLNDSEVHSQNSSVCVMNANDGNSYHNYDDDDNNNSTSNDNSRRGEDGKSKTSNRALSSETQNASDAFSVVDDHQFQAPCLSPLQVCLKLTDFGAAEFYCDKDDDGDQHSQQRETKVKTQEQVCQRRLWKAYTPMYTAPQNEDNADDDEAYELQQNSNTQNQQRQQQFKQLQQIQNDKRTTGVWDDTKSDISRKANWAQIPVNNAADIWSAGVLLYVMCTGVLPKKIYSNTTKLTSSSTCLTSNANFIRVQFTKHANHLSDLCKELIRGMLAIDPAHRMTLYDICQHA